jgi:hypothetical protein
MSRREEAENQGNSGLEMSRRFEPMGLPFPKWSMLQEGGLKKAAFFIQQSAFSLSRAKREIHIAASCQGSTDTCCTNR